MSHQSMSSPTRNSLPKKLIIIAGLVAFFAFDDVCLVILFSKIGFPALSVAVWIAIATFLVGLNFLLALAIYRLIQTRPRTGVEGLTGEKGVVLASTGTRGKVLVRGEHWDAEFAEELEPGDEVTISSLKGLVLVVESATGRKKNPLAPPQRQ